MESTRGPPRVKNKAAAPVQISAEALLREAVDRQEVSLNKPVQRFEDLEELHEYQGRKRREYEDYVRRNRVSLKNWLQYAEFELGQKEFARARSVFERALDVVPNNVQLWIRYIEAEIKNRNIMHARNLLDRAVVHLPRVDKLWYKYVYVEEMLGQTAAVRQVFERWMEWQPDEQAWNAYIGLEKRYGEYDRARSIFERYTIVHPEPRTWLKWTKFEEEFGTSDLVRKVFERAITAISQTLGDDAVDERIWIAWARFEAKLREYDRARALYKYALDRLPRSKSMNLHQEYTKFEKQWGDTEGVEDVVLSKRRRQYEDLVNENPHNYDAWFDYARLEQSGGDVKRVREVLEQAIAKKPPMDVKRYWSRYIYLWLEYAIWEELETKDMDRARQIYEECIRLVPHKEFTFAKLWLLKAHFEIRQGDLMKARKTLGRAIGMCPKDKIFRGYIELEQKLYEFERCRTLYLKQVEYNPANPQAWIKWAELERGLDEVERARGIFEIAIREPVMDMPEAVWKAFIDFEEEEGEYEKTRELYERLLEKANHPKVWISYAQFEINIPESDEEDAEVSEAAKVRARAVFLRAHDAMRDRDLPEARASILHAWLGFEKTHGSDEDVAKIQKQMPRMTKKKRRLADGTDEEHAEYVFPADDQQSNMLSKIMSQAVAWKQMGGTIAGGA